jgi:hypothetical protein|nr:MAG TPA: tail protein [Caudoviricetes sp.]
MAIKSADQITILDVSDAYNVVLTSEAYTFIGNTSGAPAGLSCTTEAVAYCGSNQCSTVNVDAKSIVCPTGITATVENSGTKSPKITFRITALITAACEATIPISVDDVTINKKFSFAVAKTGQTGQTGASGISITGVKMHYLATSAASNVTTATSGWTDTIQTTDASKKYLWAYQTISYSSGNPTNTAPAIIGTYGDRGQTGSQGVSITGVTNYYLATTASTGVTTATAGFTTTMQATDTTKKYLWSYQQIKYSNNTTSNTVPTIIGTHGATGAKGDAGSDAITLTITTSNGSIFKNNTGETVLTAHVFKGAVEQKIGDGGVVSGLGTVKWYKGTVTSSSTPIATGATYTVSAKNVLNSEVYTCQLE